MNNPYFAHFERGIIGAYVAFLKLIKGVLNVAGCLCCVPFVLLSRLCPPLPPPRLTKTCKNCDWHNRPGNGTMNAVAQRWCMGTMGNLTTTVLPLKMMKAGVCNPAPTLDVSISNMRNKQMPESNSMNEINGLLTSVPEGETPETPETPTAAEVLAEELKENIDYLMMAYKKGDKKRIMFRIGQVSRQFVILGRSCAEFPEAKIVIPNKGIIS